MSEKPPLRPEEVRRILRDLSPLSEERRIVLVGGQAVAFWAAFFELEAPDAEEKLFTSKDIDFEGAGPLGGRASSWGLDSRDVRDSAVKLTVSSADGDDIPVWLMHPERCMESRIYNVVGLKQSASMAMDQLTRSVICARAFSQHLLDEDPTATPERVRVVLRLNERIYRRCLKDQAFRKVHLDHDVDPFEAVLVDDRLPDQFCERRYPQMAKQLADRRKRSRAQRERYQRSRRPQSRRNSRAAG